MPTIQLPTNQEPLKPVRRNRTAINNLRTALYQIELTHDTLTVIEAKRDRLEALLSDPDLASQIEADDPRRVAALARLDTYRVAVTEHETTICQAIWAVANAGPYLTQAEFAEIGTEIRRALIDRAQSLDAVTTRMIAWKAIAEAACPF